MLLFTSAISFFLQLWKNKRSNYWQLWALDSRLWWPMTSYLNLSIHIFRSFQKQSTRFINMQLSIIEKRKTPVFDLISPGIGLKFRVVSFCFQTRYDFFIQCKKYIYSWALFSSKNVDPGQCTILGMDYRSL